MKRVQRVFDDILNNSNPQKSPNILFQLWWLTQAEIKIIGFNLVLFH